MNVIKFCRQFSSVIRFIILSVLTLSLVINFIPSSVAQFPSFSADSTPTNRIPKDVRRFGEIEVTSVKSPIDNKGLLEIASPTVYDRNSPEEKTPVEVRAKEIRERLWRYVSRAGKSENPSSKVTIAVLNNRPILQVQDSINSRPLRLITITEPDADYHGKTLEELAQEWQKTLQTEIDRMEKLFSPQVFLERLGQAFGVFLAMVLGSGVIWFLYRLVKKREKTLQQRYQARVEQAQTTSLETFSSDKLDPEEAQGNQFNAMRSRLNSLVHHQLSLKRKLEVYKFFKWGLFWLFIVIWYIGIFTIFSKIPILMRYQREILAIPLQLVIIWFLISFAIRLSKFIIHRVVDVWENTALSIGEAQRKALRSSTVAGALKGLATCIFILIGIALTLNVLKLPTNSIIAGGAILGLALSFGAQSLVKDLVNGFLILIEDQYAVGDVISIGESGILGGFVENLNLRVTQLRSGGGQLITIPNSTITQVQNLTRLWSRVDFSIEVAYENDPKQVLDILSTIGQEMYNESEWCDKIIEPPEVLGIDQLSHNGMLVRVWIKTFPMQQWSVGREYRYRVRLAFEKYHIQIGRPQWITYNSNLEMSKL